MTAQAIDHTRRAGPVHRTVQDKFVIRLPDGLRPRLAEVSKANYRSMNSEIIARLESSLSVADGAAEDTDYGTITATEGQLLAAFRKLESPLQQALLELFAGSGKTASQLQN